MTRTLNVTVLKDDQPFLEGEFTTEQADYDLVVGLLPEIGMDRGQAASILSGYMHARDVGPVTDEMGKVALVAAVYMMEEGEEHIEIPLEASERPEGEGKGDA